MWMLKTKKNHESSTNKFSTARPEVSIAGPNVENIDPSLKVLTTRLNDVKKIGPNPKWAFQ